MLSRTERRRQRRIRARVRKAFEPSVLASVCNADMDAFATVESYGQVTDLGKDGFHIYRDNGASVLGVAHLDSVSAQRFCTVSDTKYGKIISSPALDDRLGVYVITHVLWNLGIHVDWLLTTGEETGHSTGQFFISPKQYNWMFSFDRTGTDVVAYQYESPGLRELVRNVGAFMGQGSFSDIAFMDHLECIGLNWGVGYHDYHGPRAYAWLDDVALQVGRFADYYRRHADTLMPYNYRDEYRNWWERDYDPTSWAVKDDNDEEAELRECPICGASAFADGYCENCGHDEWEAQPRRRRSGLHDATEAEWVTGQDALGEVLAKIAARVETTESEEAAS